MQVDRQKLVDALITVLPAVKSDNRLATYFNVDNKKIQASDGAMAIEVSSPFEEEVSCAIPTTSFLSLLQSLSDEKVNLALDNQKLKVKTNRLKGTFTTAQEVKFIDMLLNDMPIQLSNPETVSDLILGLMFCKSAVAKGSAYGIFSSIRVDNKTLYATDKCRIARYTLNDGLGISTCLPLRVVELLIKHASNIGTIYFDDKTERLGVQLKDGTKMLCSTVSGDYPDLSKQFPEGSVVSVVVPDEFTTIIERHAQFLKEDNLYGIKVHVDGNLCKVSSQCGELGALEEELEIVESGSVEFRVNPKFLAGFKDMLCTFSVHPENYTVLFGDSKKQYLVKTIVG